MSVNFNSYFQAFLQFDIKAPITLYLYPDTIARAGKTHVNPRGKYAQNVGVHVISTSETHSCTNICPRTENVTQPCLPVTSRDLLLAINGYVQCNCNVYSNSHFFWTDETSVQQTAY